MSSLSTELAKRQSVSNTRNELGLCRPITVIFARGTTEPGNVGTLTGPPFFNALDAVLGAQLVHNGAAQLPAAVASSVAAVVLFGDPFNGRAFPNIEASKVKTFCFSADLICKDTIVVDAYHLAYSVDAIPAAQFVKSKVSL
ncbi:MAG: hypothetical protein Q9194_006666 [Teloschistes cf. exilis]